MRERVTECRLEGVMERVREDGEKELTHFVRGIELREDS